MEFLEQHPDFHPIWVQNTRRVLYYDWLKFSWFGKFREGCMTQNHFQKQSLDLGLIWTRTELQRPTTSGTFDNSAVCLYRSPFSSLYVWRFFSLSLSLTISPSSLGKCTWGKRWHDIQSNILELPSNMSRTCLLSLFRAFLLQSISSIIPGVRLHGDLYISYDS